MEIDYEGEKNKDILEKIILNQDIIEQKKRNEIQKRLENEK